MSHRHIDDVTYASEGEVNHEFVAALLGREAHEVSILQLSEAEINVGRFTYGLTKENEVKPAGFFKLATQRKFAELLMREFEGMEAARALGIPTTDVLTPFSWFDGGNGGVLEVSQLHLAEGLLLANNALIASAQSKNHYGQRAARAHLQAFQQPIPLGLDTSYLKKDVSRLASVSSFFEVWKKQKHIFFGGGNQKVVDRWTDRKSAAMYVAETEKYLLTHISRTPLGREYFVHNDASPRNLYFPLDVIQPALLLDFEHAATTRCLLFAQLADFGDFYHRSWPNQHLQQEFLLTLLRDLALQTRNINEVYQLLRAVVVWGTLYSSQFFFNPKHENHQKVEVNLQNLLPNLEFLESHYRVMRSF